LNIVDVRKLEYKVSNILVERKLELASILIIQNFKVVVLIFGAYVRGPIGRTFGKAKLTGRMELHELEILVGQLGPRDHGGAVAGAGVGGGAGEVGAPVAAGREDRILRPEAVQSPVLEAEGDYAPALALLHEQVQGEVLHEVVAVVAEGLPVEGVEEGVTRPVGDATAPMGLTALAELQRLAPERALVDFTWNFKNSPLCNSTIQESTITSQLIRA
jgi:hypothetical protein